jgi:SAM-dependent methyltransferase
VGARRSPAHLPALELANTEADDVVYDLGAGDGRTLIIAAREFGAQAVGIEIGPVHCFVAWLSAHLAGVASQVSMHCGDLHQADLDDADVVYLYLTPFHAKRIAPRLQEKLRSGVRVVSLAADLTDWKPTAFDRTELIFCYEMPPQPGA